MLRQIKWGNLLFQTTQVGFIWELVISQINLALPTLFTLSKASQKKHVPLHLRLKSNRQNIS